MERREINKGFVRILDPFLVPEAEDYTLLYCTFEKRNGWGEGGERRNNWLDVNQLRCLKESETQPANLKMYNRLTGTQQKIHQIKKKHNSGLSTDGTPQSDSI